VISDFINSRTQKKVAGQLNQGMTVEQQEMEDDDVMTL
jgi:hypothetical protein